MPTSTELKDEGSRWQVVTAGAAAGLVSRFCIAPLDVIKIRLQLQTHALGPGRHADHGVLPLIKQILRENGVRGFWQGNLSAELLYVAYGAAQFTAYRGMASALQPLQLPSAGAHFVAGAAAGAAATALTYPLDLLRTRFAAQDHQRVYTGFLRSISDIARTEGLGSFYRGLQTSLVQIVPYMGTFFAVYESLRRRLHGYALPVGSGDAVAGVVAGIGAKALIFPLDLIRRRIQIQGPARQRFAGGLVPEYGVGMAQVGLAIVRQEGWRALYRGLGVSLVKAAPASAVTMWTYEQTLRLLANRNSRR